MEKYLRIDNNLMAAAMLGIVVLIAFRRLDRSDRLNKVFLITSQIVIFELLLETATCVLNRSMAVWAAPLSTALHVILYSLAPVLTYFWYLLISNWCIPDRKLTHRSHYLFTIPVFVNFIITVLSPAYGLVFNIDGANVYHRGPLFVLSVSIVYFYIAYAFLLVCMHRGKIVKEEYTPMLVFGILPLIGGFAQAHFYGALLMWSSAAYSLIVVYIFLQQRMVHLDDLTGAWTRSTFEYCINRRKRQKRYEAFGLIVLDIDELKQINDEHGHFEGDYALRTTVQLIKSVLRKTDIIARTGGDEFLIILDCNTREKIDMTVDRIKDSFRKHNENSNKAYVLDCSIGAELYDSNFESFDQFMHYVDSLMYHNKRRKKYR